MERQKNSGTVLHLLENPRARQNAIDRALAERRGAPGWLGITRRDDKQAALDLNGVEVFAIDVHPRSFAHRAGLRGGFLMKDGVHIDGQVVLLQNFDGHKYAAGTEVGVCYYDPHQTGRHAGELLSTFFKLSRWPRTRPWETQPRVANGRRIMQKDRPAFLARMFRYLQEVITPTRTARGKRRTAWMSAYCYLCYLALICDNDDHAGVWPSHAESAKALGLSERRTVNDIAQQLCWFGVIKRLELPTQKRNSNLYEITEPLRYQPAHQPAPVPLPPTPPRPQTRRVRL